MSNKLLMILAASMLVLAMVAFQACVEDPYATGPYAPSASRPWWGAQYGYGYPGGFYVPGREEHEEYEEHEGHDLVGHDANAGYREHREHEEREEYQEHHEHHEHMEHRQHH